jgi:hypothetical protein
VTNRVDEVEVSCGATAISTIDSVTMNTMPAERRPYHLRGRLQDPVVLADMKGDPHVPFDQQLGAAIYGGIGGLIGVIIGATFGPRIP